MRELKQLSADELENKLETLKKELFELRFRAKCGKIEKPSRLSQVRGDIARILTLKNQVQLTKDKPKATKEGLR